VTVLQAQQTATQAFEHAAYPFDLLLDELGITRDPSRSPLFDVLLTYEEAWDAVARPTAIRLSDLTAEVPLAKFDLSLGLREQPDGTALLEFEYNADLFDESRVRTMSDGMLRMLDDLVAAPDVSLASYRVVASGHRCRDHHVGTGCRLGGSDGQSDRCGRVAAANGSRPQGR